MNTNQYNTFWPRLVATIIDSIVFIVLGMVIAIIPVENNKSNFIIVQLLYSLLPLTYFVICHGKYGYTIGKKMMNIKVTRVDEKNLIGYGRAFYRESVWFLTNMALIVYLIMENQNSDTIETNALRIGFYTSIVWSLLELVTMLMNEKRRAIHDFIAGSVVIKTDRK